MSQKYNSRKGWNAKCSHWMQQQYVRCVFEIKIYNLRATQNANEQFNWCMIVCVIQPTYCSMVSKFLNFF